MFIRLLSKNTKKMKNGKKWDLMIKIDDEKIQSKMQKTNIIILNDLNLGCNQFQIYLQMKMIALIWSIMIIVAHAKLQQVVSLFRHGARNHLNAYYDGNSTRLWWGQLTSVGQRMHQNLGKTLRKQYIDNLQFLSPNFTKGQIEVYSTHVNRTIQSAMSQLYGLYPIGTGPKLSYVKKQYHLPPYSNNSDIQQQNFAIPDGHQPIPIKFNTKIIIERCDNENAEMSKNIKTKQAEYDAMNQTYTPFLNRMADLFKIDRKSMNFHTINSLYDTLTVDQYLGRPFPQNFTNNDYLNMRHLHYWQWSVERGFNLSKAINSYKFQKVIQTFDARIKNSSFPLKWVFLSAHDSDVLPAELDLNITNSVCIEQLYRSGTTSSLNCQPGPQFASSIIFELHSQGNQFYVKIRFNGKYINLCEKKDQQCAYEQWKTRIKRYILPDVQGFCGNKVQYQQPKLDLQQKVEGLKEIIQKEQSQKSIKQVLSDE